MDEYGKLFVYVWECKYSLFDVGKYYVVCGEFYVIRLFVVDYCSIILVNGVRIGCVIWYFENEVFK